MLGFFMPTRRSSIEAWNINIPGTEVQKPHKNSPFPSISQGRVVLLKNKLVSQFLFLWQFISICPDLGTTQHHMRNMFRGMFTPIPGGKTRKRSRLNSAWRFFEEGLCDPFISFIYVDLLVHVGCPQKHWNQHGTGSNVQPFHLQSSWRQYRVSI